MVKKSEPTKGLNAGNCNLKEDFEAAIKICCSGNTIVTMLDSLVKLKNENNSIVLTDWTLFGFVIEEFKQSLVLRVGRLFDNDPRSITVAGLIDEIRLAKDHTLSKRAETAIENLEKLQLSASVINNLHFRNKLYAHIDKNRADILKDLVVTLDEYRNIFKITLDSLNRLYFEVFKVGMFVDEYYGSDTTLNEMRWLEKAKFTRIYIQNYESNDHPSLKYYLNNS